MSDAQAPEEAQAPAADAIAIVGLAGRFPGAASVAAFWRNLEAGVESISTFSEAELEDAFSDEVRRAPNFVRARPLLADVDKFDADFFGMYAREAELTDPQQRVFLECAWEALEDAACDPRRYRGAIGVFAGCSINTYFLHHVCADRRALEEFTSSYQVGCYPQLLGAGLDFLATRVSYKLDLKGPSLDLQTACSTSLMAVAQACQSLLLYQSDMALAGGVSISFPQKRGYLHQEGAMVSADGRCRPFDAQASGTVFGSGAGVVALKRLADARADGNHVYAVIRGCGVNNDGAAKVGFTAPSIAGQAAAIEMALANAGLEASAIGYVECHGTATPLGDPIEVAALTQAFRAAADGRQFCALGSVKSNIGHLDAAAGVVGLIKTALALEHGVLPASLNFTRPNPQIDFARTPFYVNAQRAPWPRGAVPRRAGVSAFGIGGTNVHVILEESPPAAAAPASAQSELLVVSARSAAALETSRANLAVHLGTHPQTALADVAFSLQLGRRAFEHRAFVVSGPGARAALEAPLPPGHSGRARAAAAPVAFMFPGQGAQYPQMGRDLYEGNAEFRRHFERCAALCEPLLGADLTRLVYPKGAEEAAANLTATAIAQPAIFAVEYALAQVWMSLGIEPVAMIGHSVGEFVAAVLAGVMRLEDALPLVVARGRLMQQLPAGAMLAVRLPEEQLRALLPPGSAIAAVNGPTLSVASGPETQIRALEAQLTARTVSTRRLQTSHAFHSPMVEPIVAPLEQLIGQLRLSAPTLPYVSCVSGTWITAAEATSPAYWARHARETVRFADGINTLAGATPAPILLEVGPGNVTSTLALQTLQGRAPGVVTSLQDAARERSDRDCVLEALGRLWTLGAEPRWEALHREPRRRVALPTYPFERKRYWIEAPPRTAGAGATLPSQAPARAAEESPAALAAADATAAAGTDRISTMSAAIAAILEQLSGNAPASLTAPMSFLEMGYDSLFLTQVAQKIQVQMRVPLTFRQLLREYPNIPALAAFLAERTAGVAVAATAQPAAASTPERPSRFAVFAPSQPLPGDSLTAEQARHIEDLTVRYTRRTAASKALTQAQRGVLADPRAAAGFRSEWKELVYPLVVERSAGSKLWDLDGNEYVDLVNGYGGTAFGHAPPFVVEAVKAQLERGFAIGPQTELAGKVAVLLAELTGNARVTFCNTGSEAVMAAMRLARTVTGREKIVVFNGDYHGQFDEVLVKGVQHAGAAPRSVPVAPGIPHAAVENMIVLDYATAQTLEWVREHATELAAVVVEPVQSRHPSLQPFEFLRELRAITAAAGTAFVLDEVVTGFRTHPGGIQGLTGIRADMATYGKVVGGGLPIGILAGSARFMDALDGGAWNFGDASFPEVGVTFFAGTFVRHPLVLAAALAVLEHLKQEGPQLQERLALRTAALAADLNQLFARYGISTRVETFSSWFYFNIHAEHPLATLLFYHLRLRGLHIQDGFPCFLTTAHSDADVRQIYEAFSESVAELHAVGILGHADNARSATPAAVPGGEDPGNTIPLTESQTEIWLAAQMGDEASCAFNESVSLALRGPLDEVALRRTLNLLFERHDALRTCFTPTGEAMWVRAASALELPLHDFAGEADPQGALAQLLALDASTPFDLVNGPPARVQLVRLAPQQHVLIFTAHHIVCDGWSINVLVSEFATVYPECCRGLTPQLPPALAFSAYARAQAHREPAEAAATERFWLERFREPVKPLALPGDRPRPPLRSYGGASRCRRIDASLYRALKQGSARSGNTLFVTLLGAFQALIGRLCAQDEVVVNVPTAGQSLLGDDILVGHCVNFLPIRVRWDANTAVAQHLRNVAREVLDASEHSNYTLGTLVRKLTQARELNRVPLAEIQFNLERLAEQFSLAQLSVEVTPNSKAHVVFDLFLNIIESEAGLRLDCDYNTDLFDGETIERWLECYQALLEGMLADPGQPLWRAPLLPEAERKRLLYACNDTARDFPRERCLHELLEARVAAQPAALAVQFAQEELSYGALDARANQLAALLLARLGGSPVSGRRVGVAVERSTDMLVALLAVLKAGCAYVPLEPGHPMARLRHILEDAAVAALITDGAVAAELVPAGTPIVHLGLERAALAALPASAPRTAVTPSDLAYVMYTSGSTGLPKGVEVTHRAVVNFLSSMALEPGLNAQDALLAVTTVSFDIAGLELYLPLLVGARVVIAAREHSADGFALRAQLERCGITAMQATPATWRLLLEAGFRAPAGFKMLCGGEALPRELAAALLAGGGELWNLYGPTETTIWSSCARVLDAEAPISVGRPIANTQFYVLDAHDQLLPPGVPGELHIGGEGVARGYRGRAELTAQKFVPNPFAPGRMYRSGDLARWRPDGQLQLLGRTDQQVKLRGFRIELGEIESALAQVAQVPAAVLLRTDSADAARLVAYYVDASGTHTPASLRAALASALPEYMIPSAWVRLERMPLSAHGKIERTALPAPQAAGGDAEEFVAPHTATELCLARIWAEVLHLPRVGANMDLLRLGADSIQLFQIIARSSREGFSLTARQLLQQRTLAAVAALVDAAPAGTAAAATRAPLPTLSQFQRDRRAASTLKR